MAKEPEKTLPELLQEYLAANRSTLRRTDTEALNTLLEALVSAATPASSK